jgi:rRNA maturation endonuclease Nob1
MKKIKNYWICKGRKKGEPNCGKIFFNNDDNVCVYCGSKNTQEVSLEITLRKLWK